MDDIEIVPTCVPTSVEDAVKYGHRAAKLAGRVHLDIDDGIFTKEFSWPFVEKGKAGDIDARVLRDVMFEAHLMVSDCRELGEAFIQAGARAIIAHVESADMRPETLDAWQRRGAREIGIAILTETDLDRLNPLLPFFKFIHVMSVGTIGAQGAAFDTRTVARIRLLRQKHPDLPIQVDGGVSRENIVALVAAGATRFSIGSAISEAADPAQSYAELLSLARSAL